jgi:hypothetical protein
VGTTAIVATNVTHITAESWRTEIYEPCIALSGGNMPQEVLPTLKSATIPDIDIETKAPSTPAHDQHPLAFEKADFMWDMQRVPSTLADGTTPHPGRSSAIFVVHGMGRQLWTETSAHLRAGFETAFEEIAEWQEKHNKKDGPKDVTLPPPFIWEGFWANYDDLKETFPEDWKHFVDREQTFFGNLWKQRIVSGSRTIAWILKQQFLLLDPRIISEVGLIAWILYWPLQIVSGVALLVAWLRFPEMITGYANDVRLYLEPRGVVERAIVQRIDERVASSFLRLIGLDQEFRHLKNEFLIEAGGMRLAFNRVVWVAHSLGTVISYNALSALLHKACELAQSGDDEQKAGVDLFRRALSRFVTMGSPLDKVAFLFKKESLRPWPGAQRRALFFDGETLTEKDPAKTEWWINFYHALDPVSGSLENPFICGDQPPSNIHIRSSFIPGLAHSAYWKDPDVLRFILGRTYGTNLLRDKEYAPPFPWVLRALALMGYISWVAILFGSVYALYSYAPSILRWIGKALLKWITG